MSTVASPTKYLIYKGTMSGDETFFTSSPAGTTSFTYGHLTPSTQYSWEVAVAANGLYSVPSNEVIATTNAGPPAPTGVTATALSTSRIKITWNPQTGVSAFRVYQQSTTGGPFNIVGTVSGTTTTFTAAGLTTMTLYSYYVIAVDSANTPSAPSATVSATTM
jgi:fibronectin type 3 domain-containing protein